jgi:MSHA pilin protein MshA
MHMQQAAFTLIELVVVIVILGLLAATALPRFISITTDGRIAKMNGAAASMASAGSLAHAAQLVANLAPASSISMEGATVTMINGYPTADATGIEKAANINTSDFPRTGTNPYLSTPDTGHAACVVTYGAASNSAPPVVLKGALISANCS